MSFFVWTSVTGVVGSRRKSLWRSLRQTEISDVELPGAEADVRGFEVAVLHVARVHPCDGLGETSHDLF